MSGGSYDYLCWAFVEDMMGGEKGQELERMIDRLAGLGYAADAAQESMRLLLEMRASVVRLQTMKDRLEPVWKAIEWWDSSDWSEDQVKEALAEYRGEPAASLQKGDGPA